MASEMGGQLSSVLHSSIMVYDLTEILPKNNYVRLTAFSPGKPG